jgi:hypothetical protein
MSVYYPYSVEQITPNPGGGERRRDPLKEKTMRQIQGAWKKYPAGPGRLPEPEAPFRSGAGISALSALRFEKAWDYRTQESLPLNLTRKP